MSMDPQVEAASSGSIVERLERLEAENRELRALVERAAPTASARHSTDGEGSASAGDGEASDARIDRRRMIRHGIIAVGAAAAGAVAFDSSPAAATVSYSEQVRVDLNANEAALLGYNTGTGSNASGVFAGAPNGVGGSFTGVTAVKGVGLDTGVAGQSQSGAGTTGKSTGGYGVYGLSTSSYGTAGRSTTSYGVVGVSEQGTGVYGHSEAAAGSGVLGDTVDGKGIYGKSTGAGNAVQGEATGGGHGLRGSAGTGKGLLASSSSGIGVHGISSSASAVYGASITGSGVEGFSSSKVGVYGRSDGDYGVYGVSTNTYGTAGRSTNSHGVVGVSVTNDGVFGTSENGNGNGVKGQTQVGAGVVGLATTGVGGQFTSNGAQLRLSVTGTRQAPILDATPHVQGEVVRDSTGDFWTCVATGTPGTWRKLSGPSTAGAFHVLASPARVYDSRTGAPQGPKAPLVGGTALTLDLKVGGSGVPAGATAAMVTLLLVNCATGDGNFTIWANGAAKPAANSMVWGGSAKRYSSLSVTGLDSAVKCQVASSLKTDFVLDVIGYYR